MSFKSGAERKNGDVRRYNKNKENRRQRDKDKDKDKDKEKDRDSPQHYHSPSSSSSHAASSSSSSSSSAAAEKSKQDSSPQPLEKSDRWKENRDRDEVKDGPIICPGHSRPVPDLAFSKETNDGVFLVSSCLDGKPMIREGQSGDWIGTFIGHKGAVWCTRLNTPATHALTASADFSAKLWNAVSGEELYSFPHKHIVRAGVFSEDSNWVYTGGKEKKLRVFDLSKPEAEPIISEAVGGGLEYLSVSQDPKLVFSSSSEEKFIRIWDQRTMTSELQLDCLSPVASISLSMDGTVLTAAAGNHLHFWDTKTFELIKSFKLGRLDCAAYHPAAGLFVTGSSAELWVRAYDYKTGQEVAVNKGHHGPVRYLAFNPSGQAYASGSEDGTIRIWEWAKEKQAVITKEKAKENEQEEAQKQDADDGAEAEE